MKKVLKYVCCALILLSSQAYARDIKIYHTGASVDLRFYTNDEYHNNPIQNLDRNFVVNRSGNKLNISLHYDQNTANLAKFLTNSARSNRHNGEYYMLGMHSIVCSNNGLAAIQKIATDSVLGIIKEKNRLPASQRNYKIMVIKYPTTGGSCANVLDEREIGSTARAYNKWVDQQIASHGWKKLVYAVSPWENNFDTIYEQGGTIHLHPTESANIEAQKRIVSCIGSVENGRNNGNCSYNPYPSAPSDLWADEITQNSVRLHWKASTKNLGLKGYEIYQNGRRVKSTSQTNTYISNLSPNVNYSFRVKAKDALGRLSGFSNYETAVTQAETPTSMPATPVTLTPKGNIRNRTPTYHWKAVAGAAVYYIWGKDSAGKVLFQEVKPSNAGCANGRGTCWMWNSDQLSYGAGRWHVIAGNQHRWGRWSAGSAYNVTR